MSSDNRGARNQQEAERSSKKLSKRMREEKAVKLFSYFVPHLEEKNVT